jgi:DNA-binding NarL/FixJ family response regulator
VDTGKPIRVVVVDDSAVDLDALCSFLKTQNRIEIVGTAKNGIELLKIVEELRPDLVITDLHLPRMSGIECTLRLRETMPDTRFIVFTDLSSPFTEADCANPGADFYLYKEHMPERIVTAIHRLYPDLGQHHPGPDVSCGEGIAC